MPFLRRLRDRWQSNPAESAALLGLALGAVALVAFARSLAVHYQVLLWGVWLAGLVVVGRLFGPVLYYDLVRSARRLRFVIVRTLYALFIAFVLCWLFSVLVTSRGWQMPTARMSDFANGFFYTFLVIQFVTVVLLTPAYTAGAIAEEKERKTLEFILATDLDNREIVLGKVVSRMLNLSLLLLAGVPILSFLQFLGGVDPNMVLAGFAATAITMFSVAGLSMLNSVMCRRARDAIVMTYLMALAYYILATAAWVTMMIIKGTGWWPELADFPSFGSWHSPVTLSDVVDWFNAGNVIFAIFKLGGGAGKSAVFDEELPSVLGGYVLFHALAGAACLGWSILRLRTLALTENVRRSVGKGVARAVSVGSRPRVGLHPMVWKEVFVEGGLRLNALGRVFVGVLFAASFLPVIITLWVYFDDGFHFRGRGTPWDEVGRVINAAQMRFVGTTVAVLMLLAVVVRAAGSVRSEHERNTFNELLTTRLTNSEILFGKWVGSVLSVRWAWVWLGMIWFVSLVTGGVQIFALPLIFVSWVVYAAVAAGVGLWFSVGSKTTLRATVASLATMLFLFGGHWVLSGLFCYFPMAAFGVRGYDFEWMIQLQAGQTPPFVLGLFAFHGDEFRDIFGAREAVRYTVASLFGVGCWAGLVPLLWLLVKRRFEQVTGRTALLRPERVAPRSRRRPAPRRALVIDADPPANGRDEDKILTVLPVDEEKAPEKGER
jgi:ABC-type transport system involved in multi-copper enzyme maturation permease subunit